MKNRKYSLFNCLDKVQRLFFVALLSVLAITAGAQSKTVSGTVIDKTGEPVIGASVVVKGTTNGTITDFDGNFSLQGVPNDGTIQISFVGYKTQDISVAGKSSVKVTLVEDTEMLDEVVVVGYGVQKKSDVTGAMVSVSSDVLMTRPVSNAVEALQGKAAGVDITSNERPGELGEIRIRGNRSISASNSPLYVVDGVPLMSGSGIETLNPRDIASIDILKDASATAIYGSRGANGVVIVTTKQGTEGKFSLNYSGTLTLSNIVDNNPSMSASDYVTYRRWAAYNTDPEKYAHPNSPTVENDSQLFGDDPYAFANIKKGYSGSSWDGSKLSDTDWTDFITQTGIAHEHTLSASGGTEKMNSYVSFGYLSNEGTQQGQWYERYTGKITTNITPVDWLTINASINATWSEQDYGMSTLKGQASSVPNAIYDAAKALYNFAVPYDDNGNIILQPGAYKSNTVVGESEKSTQQRQMFRALGNFSATIDFGKIWEPLNGLRYKLAFGPDFRHWREGAYVDGTSANRGSGANSWARLQNRRDFSWTLDNMIMFDRTFVEKHKVGVTLLQTASAWNYENSAIEAENIPRPDYLWNAFNNTNNAPTTTANNVAISSGITERQLSSYMVRLNYGFDERYLLTVTGRWDGASQLAPGHKWDFFPSASLAWRINQEEFMRGIDWISNLKLRAGIGVTGNSAVDPYKTKGNISSIMLPFNGMTDQMAYTTNEPYYVDMSKNGKTMANEALGWEKTTQVNIGVDFGFLNNRISGSIETYFSKTSDLLMSVNIPTLTGFNATWANVGKTKNHGVEITLNATPVMTKDFAWDTSLNLAYQKDEIVELAYGKNDMVDNGWFIGESISAYYDYAVDGLWQDTPEDHAEMAKFNANGHSFEPGMTKPIDQNGDYTINAEDKVIIGNRNPRWTAGWTNNFTWKGFDLGITMYGRMKYTIGGLGNALTGYDNIGSELDYWTPENTNAEFQKPFYTTSGGDTFSGQLGYRDASFIKVRNISLGYNFDKKICNKLRLNNLKVYAQAVNPFSLHQSIDWFDLDTNASYYTRSFVFGLEIGF